MDKITVESVLFEDPECRKPTGFCIRCGREVYNGGELCWVCREEKHDTD